MVNYFVLYQEKYQQKMKVVILMVDHHKPLLITINHRFSFFFS